jgi:hypothetical protein
MTLDDQKSSQYQRNEATVKVLIKLREKLLSNNISTARLAAFNLSWKQEDGLTILKEALFGDYPRTTKKAAAYGLRSMNGRMQKIGQEVLEQGLKHRDPTTKAACVKSLSLAKAGSSKKSASGGKCASGKPRIKPTTKKGVIKTGSAEKNTTFNR